MHTVNAFKDHMDIKVRSFSGYLMICERHSWTLGILRKFVKKGRLILTYSS
jgi:hypothetical protein